MIADLKSFVEFLEKFCSTLWGFLQAYYHKFKDNALVNDVVAGLEENK